MKVTISLLLLPFFMLVLQGCASHAQKQTISFHEALDKRNFSGAVAIANAFERQVWLRDFPEQAQHELFLQCYALAKVRDYRKLDECLNKLEAHIELNGDIRPHADLSPEAIGFGLGLTTHLAAATYPRLPRLFALRAELSMAYGNMDDAYLYASKALSMADEHPDTRFLEAPSSLGSGYIHILSVAGISFALAGHRDRAYAIAQRLDPSAAPGPSSFYRSLAEAANKENVLKFSLLASIYLALHDYEKALDAVSKESSLSDSLKTWGWAVASSGPLIPMFALGITVGGVLAFQNRFELPLRFTRAKSLMELGRIDEAKKDYEDIIRNEKINDEAEIHWNTRLDLGRIALFERNRKNAIEHFRKAVDLLEGQRSSINSEASRIGFVSDRLVVYERLIQALDEEGDARGVLEYVERAKSRTLVDLLASKRDFASSDRNRSNDLIAKADTSDYQIDTSTEKEGGLRAVRMLSRSALQDQFPELSSLVAVTPPDTRRLLQSLPNDETLVEYYYGGRKLYAIVARGDNIRVVRLDYGNLDEEIKEIRTLLQNPKSTNYQVPLRQAFDRLLRPLAPLLTTNNLTIVPHGILHYLPFSALYDGQHYVIEDFNLRLLPSASVLQFIKPPSGEADGALVMGNPDLGDRSFDLAFAEAEAKEIGNILPMARVQLRAEATRQSFENAAPWARIIHVAAHGTFDPDRPMTSALLLSSGRGSVAPVTVDKLYSLTLNADLVTLSACETGLSKLASGDDLIGLTRGFLFAGARSIVASLWQVDDKATSRLMVNFYQALKRSDKRSALLDAQRNLMAAMPHPFYWSPFQLIGSTQKIDFADWGKRGIPVVDSNRNIATRTANPFALQRVNPFSANSGR